MINDYSSLQTEITEWLARSDLFLSIPTFIQLAEGRINRELYTRQRLRDSLQTGMGGEGELPEDLSRIQSIVSQDANPRALRYEVVDNRILFGGTNDTPYRITYWAKIPPLSDANPTNWLLLEQPAIYLYGALIEAAPFIRDDPRLATWIGLYNTIVERMTIDDDYARFGMGPTQVIRNAV